MLLFSGMTGLYKLPTYKNQSRLATTFWMMGFIFLWAIMIFNKLAFSVNPEILFFALLWGCSFATLTAIQIYLLSRIEINTLFPINTILSMIFVVAFGLLVFAEKISILQGLGISIAIVTLYFFLFSSRGAKYSRGTLKFGLVMIFLSVFSKVVQKIAVDHVIDIKILIIYQFLFASLFLLLANIMYHRKSWAKKIFSRSYKSGLMISIPAFFGNWAIMHALAKGPFTLVYSIHSFYIFGGSIIGYFFFKEKLTKYKISLLFLAILAIIFIRIG
ncbi:EamA family transporter [Patescibacteria group bacterium]|nr:EamA family transporter [Patescibacteria group bacterium]